ncbi:Pogo transposable element [Phytophthora megakarya]|uniref:Pogo transposable element n=1 Tax=Phytophthora megakarya TaxID=4795 RepID=A0A225W5U9_9STRA|nr:Pogo transposable element [Phytophthora megakarya]
MDETAVFLDHNINTTLDVCGAMDVYVKSFGLRKNRVTAVLAASASGKKMKPAMMVKSSTYSIQAVEGVVMLRGGNSWMTSEWVCKWTDYCFPWGFDYTRGGNVKAPNDQVVGSWLTRASKVVTAETIFTSFRRWFLGADDQLSLTTHSFYGLAFAEMLVKQRENDTSVEDDEDTADYDDSNDFIHLINELDL